MPQACGQLVDDAWLLDLAFPDGFDLPPRSAQGSSISTVLRLVGGDLLRPCPRIEFGRHAVERAAMTVPEAAAYEDDGSALRQYDVRPAGKISGPQTEAQALRVKPAPDGSFRARILGLVDRRGRSALGSGQCGLRHGGVVKWPTRVDTCRSWHRR